MMQSEPMVQPSWLTDHYYTNSILEQDSLNMDFCPSDQGYDSQIIIEGFEDVCKWLCDDDNQQMEEIPTDSYVWSPSMSMNSSDACAYVPYETQSSMVHNDDAMEIESQTGHQNLLMAYSEAIGLGQLELAKVIQKCVCQKASPVGPAIERLALNLFKCGENEGEEYLKQESMRNFKTAFRAFYEIFPYGRFAHFTANSAILEAVPTHVESIHIVDFDLCEGSQWPPVIQAIARMKKSLIITRIKLDQDQDWQFEHTNRQLCNFARSFGLNLKVQEMDMAQIVKNVEGNNLESEFMVFNCMVGLPHMGRTRNTSQAMDFLKVAKAVLDITEGIITFGDGEEREKMRTFTDFSSFFNKKLIHYKALYESMEWGFPSYFSEARIAMETLFVSPFISSKSWLQKWAEGRENMASLKEIGLKGQPLSKESLNEARELVKEGESPYGIRIEGENGKEMVLEWNGTPLVRVSAWM
ncbi:nodulation-signaling pathway 2 protein-like protein [Tanacetum coccineum]|uniref:Nodulation-signaling pathway 2 protein-like protein n=1 Tax=Tanacetum coccineum TaxID=301880 RepID=A0ABQ5EFV1_9ASTR